MRAAWAHDDSLRKALPQIRAVATVDPSRTARAVRTKAIEEWQPSTMYERGSTVTWRGATYRARTVNYGCSPDSAAIWDKYPS